MSQGSNPKTGHRRRGSAPNSIVFEEHQTQVACFFFIALPKEDTSPVKQSLGLSWVARAMLGLVEVSQRAEVSALRPRDSMYAEEKNQCESQGVL